MGFLDRGIMITMKTNTEKIFTFIDTYAETADTLYMDAIVDACQKWLLGESQPELTMP